MLNQVQLIGHLGREPEIRQLPSGGSVANLALATTEKWKDKNTGEQKEATEWHRVTVFDRLADICGQYLHKGSLIYISGKNKTRKYQDKDGVEKFATEVHANEMKMLGGKGEQSAAQAPRPAPQPKPAPKPAPQADFDDGDIPF